MSKLKQSRFLNKMAAKTRTSAVQKLHCARLFFQLSKNAFDTNYLLNSWFLLTHTM